MRAWWQAGCDGSTYADLEELAPAAELLSRRSAASDARGLWPSRQKAAVRPKEVLHEAARRGWR